MDSNQVGPLQLARAYDPDACWAAPDDDRILLVSPRAAEAVLGAFPGSTMDDDRFDRVGFVRVKVKS